MSEGEIDAMPAGREMDCLVAEKVMGWQRAPEYQFPNWLRPDGCWVWSSAIMPYSTNIAHAWDVVERITRVPQSLEELRRAANTKFYYWWEANSDLCCHSAPEAALLICRAALKFCL